MNLFYWLFPFLRPYRAEWDLPTWRLRILRRHKGERWENRGILTRRVRADLKR